MKHKLQLQVPIDVNGHKYESLEIRRPKGRDLKKMSRTKGSDNERMAAMLCDLAEIPPDVIDEMDGADFIAAARVVGDFLGVSQANED